MPPKDRILLETPRFTVVERHQPIAKTEPSPQEVPSAEPDANLVRQVILHPGAVVILPLLDDGRICLIRNLRVAVDKELVELPAGTLETGESPLTCAQRELREETGYQAERWQQLPSFFMSPGILNERMHAFVAEGLTAGDPQREAGENITNLLVDAEAVFEMVRHGEIEDAKTLATLFLWNRR